MTPKLAGTLFWFSCAGVLVDLVLFDIARASPVIAAAATIFLCSAAYFAVGAISNYLEQRRLLNRGQRRMR